MGLQKLHKDVLIMRVQTDSRIKSRSRMASGGGAISDPFESADLSSSYSMRYNKTNFIFFTSRDHPGRVRVFLVSDFQRVKRLL